MDKEPEKNNITQEVDAAYGLLVKANIIEVIEPPKWGDDIDGVGWVFKCFFSAPSPNKTDIPIKIKLRVLILENFPFSQIIFYSESEALKGFPHQDAETHKLCLPLEDNFPRDSSRLLEYVKSAKNWINDAAQDELLKNGEPYELPDFSCKKAKSQSSFSNLALFFVENSKSYKNWKNYIGKSGNVSCFIAKELRNGIFIKQFLNKENKIICDPSFSESIQSSYTIYGKWLILPDIRYYRHRPPQTYEETRELCHKYGIEFNDIMKQAWKMENHTLDLNIGLVLIGFPIPSMYGGASSEIHWQPLFFNNLRHERKQKIKNYGNQFKPRIMWENLLKEEGAFFSSQPLLWGKSENISRERMYARGSYPLSVVSSHIAVIGCGALGSVFAESFARGGVKKIDLFDNDIAHFGNLCRHTLDGSRVGYGKAVSLAQRLAITNPLSEIKGYPIKLPMCASESEEVSDRISKVDLLIDCSANESAFEWLDKYSRKNDKKLISVFINFRAEILTLLISGDETGCKEIGNDLYVNIKKGNLPISWNVYYIQPSKEEQIIEGSGCWHPTFPALNIHIQMLAAAAVEIINDHVPKNFDKGLAVLIRRKSIPDNMGQGILQQEKPLIEILWAKQYH
ncbi:MAG TPA: ThiF family adenylyltransferase [Candidatus Limnocylindrales bacterium]|nr:ThiF family adenylyltransferase [Candidatus Limnocylindrales bacterium]